MAARYDFDIWRGNNQPAVKFIFPFDIASSSFIMRLTIDETTYSYSSDDGDLIIDETDNSVVWPYTVEISREIPLGKNSQYELERRVSGGEQRTYLYGYITGRGGLNDD